MRGSRPTSQNKYPLSLLWILLSFYLSFFIVRKERRFPCHLRSLCSFSSELDAVVFTCTGVVLEAGMSVTDDDTSCASAVVLILSCQGKASHQCICLPGGSRPYWLLWSVKGRVPLSAGEVRFLSCGFSVFLFPVCKKTPIVGTEASYQICRKRMSGCRKHTNRGCLAATSTLIWFPTTPTSGGQQSLKSPASKGQKLKIQYQCAKQSENRWYRRIQCAFKRSPWLFLGQTARIKRCVLMPADNHWIPCIR